MPRARTKKGVPSSPTGLGLCLADDPAFLITSFLRAVLGFVFGQPGDHGKGYPARQHLNGASIVLFVLTQRVVLRLPSFPFNLPATLPLIYDLPGMSQTDAFLRFFLFALQSARLSWGHCELVFRGSQPPVVSALTEDVPFCLDVHLRRMMLPSLCVSSQDFLEAVSSVFCGSLFLTPKIPLRVTIHHVHPPDPMNLGVESHVISHPTRIRVMRHFLPYCRSMWFSVECGCEPILHITCNGVYLHHVTLLNHLPELYRSMHRPGVRGLTYAQISMDLDEGDCDLPANRLDEMVRVAIEMIHRISDMQQYTALRQVSHEEDGFFACAVRRLGFAPLLHMDRVRYPLLMADDSVDPDEVSELKHLTLSLHVITTYLLLLRALQVCKELMLTVYQGISFVVLDTPQIGRHLVKVLRNSMLDASPGVDPCYLSNINFHHTVPAGLTTLEELTERPDALARWLCDISHLTVSFVQVILGDAGVVLELLECPKIVTWTDICPISTSTPIPTVTFTLLEEEVLRSINTFRKCSDLGRYSCLSMIMLQLIHEGELL